MTTKEQRETAAKKAAQEVFEERARALEAQGLTFDYLARKLKRELNAKETKFFQKDGMVIEQRDVVAWDVRQRARIDAHKLRGDYPAEKRDLNLNGPLEVVLRDCVKEVEDPDGKG